MKAVKWIRRLSGAGLALVLFVGLAACNNPVEHEEDHPIGLVVLNASGQEVARINIEASAPVTGLLNVGVNATQTFTVAALSENGGRIEIDGDELGLQAAVQSAQVASATVQGANRLVITGNQAGTTGITLTLLHEGHAELSQTVPLQVTP